MPTTFGLVMMGLLVALALVGLVLYVRQVQARRTRAGRRLDREDAPYEAEIAARHQAERFGGSGSAG